MRVTNAKTSFTSARPVHTCRAHATPSATEIDRTTIPIATLVRFHRGKDPRPVYAPFADLPEGTQRACVVLVGLLRVAHAIGRGYESEVLQVAARKVGGSVVVSVSGADNPEGAIDEARQASGLLAKTFGREVLFEVPDSETVASA